MRKIKAMGLVIVAVFAVNATVVANALAALEFNSSAMGKLVGSAINTQTFSSKAGTMECPALKVAAGEAVLKSSTLLALVKYENCTFFKIVGGSGNADYEFSTDGSVKLLNTMTFKFTSDCTMAFPAGQISSTVTYKDVGKKIIIEESVDGLVSSGTGSLCTYAAEKSTIRSGLWLVELPGGTIEA